MEVALSLQFIMFRFCACSHIWSHFLNLFVSGDKYINGEIIPCKYPTYQPKPRNTSKYESRRYERRRDGPPGTPRKPKQETAPSESASS